MITVNFTGIFRKILILSIVSLIAGCGGGGGGGDEPQAESTPQTDSTPPVIELVSPINAQILSGIVTVSATATDNTAIASVSFFVDSNVVSSTTSPPYEFYWDTTTYVDKSQHTLYAEAVDGSGNVGRCSPITVVIDNTVPDTSAPNAVTDLAAAATGPSTVALSWTAPGDDGASGTASSYDIRYALMPINTSNWDNATPCQNEPAPSAGGTHQVFEVTGLSADTLYYFAMRTADDAGNLSGLSNLASSTTSRPLFKNPVDYTMGNCPNYEMEVVAANLNNDGFQDLIVTMTGDYMGTYTISVLLNKGDGSFGNPTRYSAGTFPKHVCAADLNGDGFVDLAVAGSEIGPQEYISILFNKGDGTFGSAIAKTYSIGRAPAHIDTADLDMDGDYDLIITNQGYSGDPNSSVSLFFNNGTGTFSAEVNYTIGREARKTSIADVDGDGDPDMVTACYDRELAWLIKNLGKASFAAPVSLISRIIGHHSTYAVAQDLDGDGDIDLAVSDDYPNTVIVLHNRGGGAFDPAVDYRVGDGPFEMAAVDFNLDGSVDILTCNGRHDNTVSLLLNRGDGTFKASIPYSLVPRTPLDFAFGDFDGDGDADMAITYNGGTQVTIFYNTTIE